MTDLTDRMRTCAAAIVAVDPKSGWVALISEDAANLLIEASNALEAVPPPLGEPMEIIEPKPISSIVPPGTVTAVGTWIDPGGALPQPRGNFNPRACPQCDSRTTKKVVRLDRKLMLVCPVCSAQWEWKR